MTISATELEQIKLYCKIDFNFEDELLKEIVEAVEEQICEAIEKGSTAETFKKYKKFNLAVKKQVKEEYEHRGLSADSERYPLANGVLNIIHQLRYRGDSDEDT